MAHRVPILQNRALPMLLRRALGRASAAMLKVRCRCEHWRSARPGLPRTRIRLDAALGTQGGISPSGAAQGPQTGPPVETQKSDFKKCRVSRLLLEEMQTPIKDQHHGKSKAALLFPTTLSNTPSLVPFNTHNRLLPSTRQRLQGWTNPLFNAKLPACYTLREFLLPNQTASIS